MIRDRRFLRYYEQELRFVRDLAGEFASEHARVANRFGLGEDSCADPHVEWLLDGFAFLAARVQHRLDGDHAVLSHHLLELVVPGYLAPTPATAIVAFDLAPDAPVAEDGLTLPRGTRLVSRPVPNASARCVFTTAHPVTVWPVTLVDAQYIGPAALAALDLPRPKTARTALSFRLKTRNGGPFSALALDRLVLHLTGNDHIAHSLYEALVGHCVGIAGRSKGTAKPLAGNINRLGFSDGEALFPHEARGFSGHRLLREYFSLPGRFLFTEITGLAPLVRQTEEDEIEIYILLGTAYPVLEGSVVQRQFSLFATPVANLFHRRAAPLLIDSASREHHVVADRMRPIDYEIHSITGVVGYGEDASAPVQFCNFYDIGSRDHGQPGSYFTVERRPRLLSERETATGAPRSAYLGAEVYLQLCDEATTPVRDGITRLEVETLCTNRDLPLRLQLPAGEVHFTTDAGPVTGAHVLGTVTAPGPSLVLAEPAEGGLWGDLAWRLATYLALSHQALVEVEKTGNHSPAPLQALLALHAAVGAPELARQVPALTAAAAHTVLRRLPGGGPAAFARGQEISINLTEGALPNGGAFVLGGVLEVFLRRHASLNSFVETVVCTAERGEIMRWPPRIGTRHLV
ncbi:type VI secretion system protein ImpG [Skermanella aerolata]|uniref:type VI secretion system baseplate subunit TssF n=1 Tax=Skermanella aerolata TaxID=393310 RepID=UPI003D1E6044